MDKRGGYLRNDVFPPGVWMDNIPSWEYGLLFQIRDMSRAMRIDFSRSQTQSTEDKDLAEAEGKLFFSSSSWIFPQTEDQYRKGIDYIERYLTRLADADRTNAQFYAAPTTFAPGWWASKRASDPCRSGCRRRWVSAS